jgi:methyl-accepting chemotaxis protein
VDSHSRDELHKVGGAVNSVAQTLQSFATAQLDMARAHNEQGLVSHEIRASSFEGAYGDIARNLNAMVAGHIDVQTRFTALMGEYAAGKFDSSMPALPGERKAISDAADQVRGGLEQAAKTAAFNAQVKAALDHVTTPVRIADNDGRVLYINHALKSMLVKYEAGFRQACPSFNPDKVVGGSVGIFYADPGAALANLRSLKAPVTSRIVLGGRDCEVVTAPVFDEKGERLGTAGQWSDLTEQLAAEREVAGIVEAAAAGDFRKRIEEAGKQGFLLQMAQGLNAILATSEEALGHIASLLKALAKGDLTQEIGAQFKGVFAELAADSNATTTRLRAIVTQIHEASDSINTAAREIAIGNNDLSRRTEEQASSLEETASSMEQLSTTVRHNAGNADQANALAAEASETAARGGEVMSKVVSTMASITGSNREIADITTVIDGIAFQTNLLALNASVEAARAGEQGRGFAVVASEVRSLAQRAAEAAKNIKVVIANSVGKVEEGSRLVQTAGAAMEEIVVQVKRVSAIVGEIAAASKEQSGGIDQVNQAVTNIDQITQQNAALVEEATAAARSLEEQSEALVQSISVFKIGDGKPASQAAPGWRNAEAALH